MILRFEIRRALIEGEAEVDDLPALWDAGMQALLGLDTRGNFKDGPMQDIHWPSGAFGYFPATRSGPCTPPSGLRRCGVSGRAWMPTSPVGV